MAQNMSRGVRNKGPARITDEAKAWHLEVAAAVVKQRGLYAGDFCDRSAPRADAPVSAYGAINVAVYGNPMMTGRYGDAVDQTALALVTHLGLEASMADDDRHVLGVLDTWAADKSADEVVAAMRAAADALETGTDNETDTEGR